MSSPTDRSSMLATKDLDALKPSSSQWCWAKKCQDSTRLPTNRSWSAMSTSARTSTTTSSCQEEQLCIQASPRDSARKSLLWLLQPWRSRSSLLRRESSWSGSEDQSSAVCQHSKPCGSPRQSIKSPVQPSSIENASDSYRAIINLCLAKYNIMNTINIIY